MWSRGFVVLRDHGCQRVEVGNASRADQVAGVEVSRLRTVPRPNAGGGLDTKVRMPDQADSVSTRALFGRADVVGSAASLTYRSLPRGLPEGKQRA